ncbi:MAG: ABC transporter ATP-binding protein [Paracoccaceae bacterium]
MIRLERLTKSYRLSGITRHVARDLCTVFPAGVSVALLGRNGAGKSTLLRLIAGGLQPDRGRVVRSGSVSWPVGHSGSFHKDLTAVQNIRFVARCHGVDTDALVDFVRDFAQLGQQFDLPLHSYSSGMRARLSFGLSFGLHFDCYLVDEVTAVGDAAFRARSERVIEDRLRHSGAIIVSHSKRQVLRLCKAGAVLEDGRLTYYPDVTDALAAHEANLAQAAPDALSLPD